MTAARPAPRPPGDRGQGRPAFEPTPDQRRVVALLRGVGVPPEQIAREVGCAYSTLRRHFAGELAHGRGALVARIGCRVVQRALAGDLRAAKFYLRSFAPDLWGRKSWYEVAGGDGETSAAPMLVVNFLPDAKEADEPGQAAPLQPKADGLIVGLQG